MKLQLLTFHPEPQTAQSDPQIVKTDFIIAAYCRKMYRETVQPTRQIVDEDAQRHCHDDSDSHFAFVFVLTSHFQNHRQGNLYTYLIV